MSTRQKTEKSIIIKGVITLSLLIIAGFSLVTYLQFSKETGYGGGGSLISEGQLHRDLANKLKGVGLTKAAIMEYEKLLSKGDISVPTRANISYSVGLMYMESGQYDQALRMFYQAEILGGEGEVAKQVSKKIVECLERLKKYSAAEYALKTRASLKKEADEHTKSGEVVARIGEDIITLGEINEVYDILPPQVKENFTGEEGKQRFAQQYVAEDLLKRKARKLGYDEDEDILREVERYRGSLMVQKVLQDELKDKLSLSREDLNNYYLANKKKFGEKDFEEVKEEVSKAYLNKKFQDAYRDLLLDTLAVSDVEMHLEKVE